MFQRIVKFTVLKVAEIAGFWFVVIKGPSWFGSWIHTKTHFMCLDHPTDCGPFWFDGFIMLVIMGLAGGGIFLLVKFCLPAWIKKNWEWAGR